MGKPLTVQKLFLKLANLICDEPECRDVEVHVMSEVGGVSCNATEIEYEDGSDCSGIRRLYIKGSEW